MTYLKYAPQHLYDQLGLWRYLIAYDLAVRDVIVSCLWTLIFENHMKGSWQLTMTEQWSEYDSMRDSRMTYFILTDNELNNMVLESSLWPVGMDKAIKGALWLTIQKVWIRWVSIEISILWNQGGQGFTARVGFNPSLLTAFFIHHKVCSGIPVKAWELYNLT